MHPPTLCAWLPATVLVKCLLEAFLNEFFLLSRLWMRGSGPGDFSSNSRGYNIRARVAAVCASWIRTVYEVSRQDRELDLEERCVSLSPSLRAAE